jgi:CheY-like chemotaxis protein
VPKILVADDNANIQKMVALSFEDRGVEVVSVGNGEAAVRRIPDVNPDLVLADIFMPVRNGYEVCEFVKKDSRFSHVPVILLVGAFDPLDEKEARRVGADGVLKKPFVPPDPLIAMVMSALEKNPKLAAELAKAREAKQAPRPVEIESIPEPATSIRAELKPLPTFPDPTPEEEALLYGTGSGRRTLDDASVGTESAKEPQPPVSAFDEAAEEEFDSTSTSRDWRRNAMDIEIPAEAANLAAFVRDDELDSPIFPSERDVPSRRVADPESVEVIPSLLRSQVPAPAAVESPLIEPPALSTSTAESDFFASSDSEPLMEETTALSPASVEPAPVFAPEPTAQPQTGPTHWMDQLAQGPTERPSSDWMSVLTEQTVPETMPATPQAQHDESSVASAPQLQDRPSEPESHSDASAPVSLDSAPTQPESGEDTFFVDEPSPSLPSAAWFSPTHNTTQHLTEPEVDTIEHTAIDSVPVAPKTEETLEADPEPDPLFDFKDPDLVQPPAVHVTPEPLLMDEEPSAPVQYGSDQQQDLEPTHSTFPVPSFAPPAEEPPSMESPAGAAAPEPLLEAPPAEDEASERIPTGPPPNREALAEIPFLTPPPDFFTNPAEKAPAAAADPGTVDAVVQKVIEKLQPQLQDLLSKGVLKPLVESLLQNEAAKKNQ